MTVSARKVWTYEDYRQLPDDGIRYEVIEGHLYLTPAPTSYHQTISRRLQFLFYQLELEEKGLIFDAPIDLLMPGATPVQPDLVYLLAQQESMVTRRGIEGVPELVVEILSSSTATRDRTVKLHLYERCGVRRFIIVDPPARTLELFLLDGESYRLEASIGPEDQLEIPDYSIVIDMTLIFKGLPEEL
jgi:Uma2 family endonuclease